MMLRKNYTLEYKHAGKRLKFDIGFADDGNIEVAELSGAFPYSKTPLLLEKVKTWVNADVMLPRIRIFLSRERAPYEEVDFLMRLAEDLERLRSSTIAAVRG